jgi:hypothetical protein
MNNRRKTRLEEKQAAMRARMQKRSAEAAPVEQPSALPKEPRSYAKEKHWTPAQIAEKWGTSEDTVRAIFRNMSGVLKIPGPGNGSKRSYVSLHIPEPLLIAVWEQFAA